MDLNITLADVLTPAGFVAAAALVSGIVEIGKRIAARIVSGREQVGAALLAAALVVLAMVDRSNTTQLVLGDVLIGAVSWYGITRLALGVHDDVAQKPNSLTGPTG